MLLHVRQFKKIVCLLLLVSALGTAQSPGAVVALKRNTGLTAGGSIDARFNSATVVTTTVSDTGIHVSGWYSWQNYGMVAVPGMSHNLYRFDLSSIPAGSRINLAQLRIYHSSGNGTYGNAPIGMVLTHDWIEGTQYGTYPGAAGGASGAHPVGYNTGINQNASGGAAPPWQSWGPASDNFFSLPGDVGPLTEPTITAYHVYDVTAHVQAWGSGNLPNRGWAHYQGLWTFIMSESGSANQPVLFIDYTPGGGSPDTTAPAAVANLNHGPPGSSWLTITWSAPGDDAGTGTACYYDLRYSTSPINDSNWANGTQVIGEPAPAAAGASQSCILENLTPNTTYYFAIKTYDEVWNASALSNIASVTTLTGTPAPAAIGNLAASYPTGTSAYLTWTAPGGDYNTGTAAAYDLRYSTSPITEANWSSATPFAYGVPAPAEAGTNQGARVVYLNMLTTYYYAIKTVDGDGNWSPLSNVASQGTKDDDLTAPATVDLAVSNPAASAVTLSWNAPGDDAIFGAAAYYDIRYSTTPITEDSWFWTATKVTGEPAPLAYNTSQSMTVTGLNAGTTYYFALRTVDEEMNWSDMALVSATTLTASDGTAPAAVSTLAASHPSSGTVRLTWTATGDDGSSGTATTYDIRYSTGTISEANWASAQQISGELAPQVAGTTQTWTAQELSANTAYTFAIKVIDEAGHSSAISNVVSSTTLTAGDLNKAVLTEQDFEYLGAFKMPTTAGGQTTAFQSGGIAIRRVNGNLQILAEAGRLGWSRIYECTFPGWGQTSSTWPQANVIYDWTRAVYGSPAMMNDYLEGLSYDAATDRLYFSWGIDYNTGCVNHNGLGWAELIAGAPAGHGPWHGNPATANNHRIRGGSTIIPDWFANAYVDGRRLGLGFGGAYSGMSCASYGPYLAATMPPDADWPSQQDLDTVTLLDYTAPHWAARDADYLWTPLSEGGNPINGVGQWTLVDEIDGAGVWIDLPDRHGVVFMPAAGHGHIAYVPGGLHTERLEIHRLIYDPKDLAAVAQGTMQPWQPEPQNSIVPLTPHVNFNPLGGRSGLVSGLAFDAQTRTLFAIVPPGYNAGGQELYPLVHGWRVRTTSASPDPTAPAAVSDLAVGSPTTGSLTLTWTAPGDDGNTGTAASYDIRYSSSTINEGNWASATQCGGEPAPLAAGNNQSFTVNGLDPSMTYYFAMKTSDEVLNTSAISNVRSGTTASAGGITPPGVFDTTTQGNWRGVYGTDGYILAGFNGPQGVGGADNSSLPSYISSYTVGGMNSYTWAMGTSSPYDLQAPSGSSRNIGCWYTTSSGTITLVPSQSRTFLLRVYLRDFDSVLRSDDLSFTGAGLTGTDTVVCTAGKWITYTVTAAAGTNIVLTLGHEAGVNSTISALLFDPAAKVGDVNGDGVVDVVDLLYFVDAFGSVAGDANYDSRCDFNSDASVDVVDLLMLVETFGT